MTELKDPSAAAPSVGPSPSADPLARLHHMSTTAGISSQEYVAINLPSVIATLLGLASLLAKLDAVLLLIPLAGVVVGGAALSQIKGSNGTQTGRGFAIAGMALSLLIGGGLLTSAAIERFSTKSDERVVVEKMVELGQKIKSRQYASAYDMFNDRFKARIKADAFETRLKGIDRDMGAIQSFEWNGVAPMFAADPGNETHIGWAIAKVGLGTAGGAGRWQVNFRNAGAGWTIDDLPSVFPPENQRGGKPPQR